MGLKFVFIIWFSRGSFGQPCSPNLLRLLASLRGLLWFVFRFVLALPLRRLPPQGSCCIMPYLFFHRILAMRQKIVMQMFSYSSYGWLACALAVLIFFNHLHVGKGVAQESHSCRVCEFWLWQLCSCGVHVESENPGLEMLHCSILVRLNREASSNHTATESIKRTLMLIWRAHVLRRRNFTPSTLSCALERWQIMAGLWSLWHGNIEVLWRFMKYSSNL